MPELWEDNFLVILVSIMRKGSESAHKANMLLDLENPDAVLDCRLLGVKPLNPGWI